MKREHESDRSRMRPAFAGLSCFLAVVQVLCLGMGVAGFRSSRFSAIGIVVVASVSAWLFARRFREDSLATDRSPRPLDFLERGLSWLVIGVTLWAGWVWLQLLVLAFHRPPLFWDSLVYHLPAIHDWVMRGRVGFVETVPDIPFVNYPMGIEVTVFLVHSLLGTSRLVDASNLWYWPLAFTGLGVLAEQLGARGPWPWAAGALLFGAPTFLGQAATVYVDAGFASCVMGAVAAAVLFVSGSGERLWEKGLLLGLNVGLMLGAKGTGLVFALVVGGAVVAGSWWRHRGARWKGWPLPLSVAGLLALAVGGYWYARNAVVTGNPLYPFRLQLGPKVIAEGYDPSLLEQTPLVLVDYPRWSWAFVSWLQPEAPIHGAFSVGGGGLGYLWLVGGIPAVFLLWGLVATGTRIETLPALLLASCLVVIFFAIQPAAFESRYTLWLHSLGLPSFAAVASHAADRWRRDRRHLVTLVWVFVIIGIAVWESRQTLKLEWATGRDPNDETGTEFQTTIEVWFPGLETTPGFEELLRSKKIARGRWRSDPPYSGSLLGGMLVMPLEEREILVLPPTSGDYSDPVGEGTRRQEPSVEEVAGARDRGAEWLLWETSDPAALPASLAGLDERYVFRITEGAYFTLFRLAPRPAAELGVDEPPPH